MTRSHLPKFIALCLVSAFWLFLFLSAASFSTSDWPAHAVYPYQPVQNLCGPVGSALAYYCLLAIGQGLYPILLFSGVCIVLYFAKGKVGDLWLRAIGLLLLSTAFAAAYHQLKPGSATSFPEGNGGLLGIATGEFLKAHFNGAGAMLILVTSFLVGLLLAADDLVLKTAPAIASAAMSRVAAGAPGEEAEGAEGGAPASGLVGKVTGFFRNVTDRFNVSPRGDAAAANEGEDDDLPEIDDKRVLLKRHNLDDDEINLTYANDEPVASPNAEGPATETAMREDPADFGPAAAMEIPPPAAPAPAVINGAVINGNAGNAPVATAAPVPSVSSSNLPPPLRVIEAQAAAGQPVAAKTEIDAPPAVHPNEAHPMPQAEGVVVDQSALVVRNAAALRPKVIEPQVPKELGDYTLPAWSFLAEPEEGYAASQEKYVREKAATLEQALREFGLDARVVSIDTGPVITMYELSLPPGVKVAAISQLGNDMARALKATSVRIVAPVPGKDTVGIEVPNPQKEKVRLKELFAGAPEAREKMIIPIFYGKDASGEVLVSDLTKMPHCLIAGTTGSGKSVCINTIVMSIMYHQRPDQVKLILVDPKVVELKPFEQIPHLMCPPINDPNKAPSVLEWLCTKMDERYELLAEAAVRQIGDYNKLTREQLNEIFQPSSPEEEAKIPKFMPYIVVIIDELADLMMMSGKEVEAAIVRLAQKSRAVGIHVVLATQRPQANVVTGLIKANMPSRIAFRVQSRMDSRIVLDQNGAELLLGQGDMLFMPNGASKPIRGQGTYIDDMEVRQSVKLVKGLAEAQYEPELVQIRQVRSDSEFEHDDLYDDAVKVVIETKRGSVSLLQRRLSIGYARASRLIERMAATGILGDYKGSQSREVLFTLEEWEAAKAQMKTDADSGMSV